jgi:hypothetical protein
MHSSDVEPFLGVLSSVIVKYDDRLSCCRERRNTGARRYCVSTHKSSQRSLHVDLNVLFCGSADPWTALMLDFF